MKTVKLLITLILLAFVGSTIFVGCEKEPPAEPPEAVVKSFYRNIAEGGPTALDEAYKLIHEGSRVSKSRFVQVVKKYPEGFYFNVIGSETNGEKALVDIEYRMSSLFGGEYKIKNGVALLLDEKTNTWKVDFTGESHNDDKTRAIQNK